jgi:drug/metabolite transporter (DMT)-like permease
MSLQTPGGSGRQETPLERVDRNMEELNGELRVVVTGVQVLFAFLLVVPFDTGFNDVGNFERAAYFVTLIFAALAAACTIAPSAQHRFLFRHDDKPRLVFVANRVVLVGLAFLAVAMCGCLLLVATKLFGVGVGVLTMVAATVPFGTLWFAMPLRRRHALDNETKGDS